MRPAPKLVSRGAIDVRAEVAALTRTAAQLAESMVALPIRLEALQAQLDGDRAQARLLLRVANGDRT